MMRHPALGCTQFTQQFADTMFRPTDQKAPRNQPCRFDRSGKNGNEHEIGIPLDQRIAARTMP